jgi:choline dehydrogenase-like flavoprotein
MMYVVGSGPTGVACAKALIDRGFPVTMLDAGLELDSANAEKTRRLAALPRDRWLPADLAFLKTAMAADTKGILQKNALGSDHPFRGTDGHIPLESDRVEVVPTFAKGGFSTVWGAAVLPYIDEDLRDWPLRVADLSEHYEAVLKFVPLAAEVDDLAASFPLYTRSPGRLRLARQSRALLEDLSAHREALKRGGLTFGRSRLAVRAQPAGESAACCHCGLCLYGCPFGCIYGSDQTLTGLVRGDAFRYRKDVVVKKIEESADGVKVRAQDRLTRAPLTFDGSRVFLACGVLSTTKVLLESMAAYGRTLRLAYSQHFMFPLVRSRSEKGVRAEESNTLAQLFLEMRDAKICLETVHLQVYAYNDLYERVLLGMPGGVLFRMFPACLDWLIGRIMIVQGYLHSDRSGHIDVSLRREAGSAEPRLRLVSRPNPAAARTVRAVVKRLHRLRSLTGAVPAAFLLKIAGAGQGYHHGGTFPMRRSPGEFESDVWGRPHGFRRVHAVDSTVFPSLPATTVTLTAMANAHRIASRFDERS